MTYEYTPVTFAGKGPLPGTVHLVKALKALTGCQIGSFNPRCVQQCGLLAKPGARTCPNGHGLSHHAESTAADVMSTDPAVHAKVIEWCFGPWGEAFEVQEIVTGYPPASAGINGPARWVVGQGWRPYRGGPSAHRDHVHLSMTFDAAILTEPPVLPPKPPEPGEDKMISLIRLKGWWNTYLFDGVTANYIETSDGAQELVDKGLIPSIAPHTPFNEKVTVLEDVPTFCRITGFVPSAEAGGKPSGEV